ncbi:hypothetical protein UFOVP247_35 [uncultured Caudovirales phage]|uniref:Uncharacterized protein n=1 Tax=uncultured Caudovirales phage TaxID=2100421 RepID=A0A6J7WS22_9CAUD|nr:hypothetical protein UFOVP247_35 [uncultured Caudovirales phage]
MWDKLIIVVYNAGTCGEFFCNLLNRSLTQDTVPLIMREGGNNTYLWKKRGELDILNDIGKLTKYWEIKYKSEYTHLTYIEEQHPYYEKIFKIIGDEDVDVFIENLYEFARDMHSAYKDKECIFRSHYINKFYHLNFLDMFPGSTAFYFEVNSIKHIMYAQLLDLMKNYYNDNPLRIPGRDYLFARRPGPKKTFNRMIPIDSGRLFFEDDYQREAEEILSESLKKKIVLDTLELKSYKSRNFDMISSVLGKDFRELDIDSIAEKIILHLEENDISYEVM